MIAITVQEDAKTFYFLQNLTNKNFTKKIGKKNKIIIFKQNDESVQRRYFLKLVSKIYKRKNKNSKKEELEKIKNSTDKSIKLTLLKSNQILHNIDINMRVEDNYVVVFKFDINYSILVTYIKNYFKDHLVSYRTKTKTMTIYPNGEKTILLLEKLLKKRELLGNYITFHYDIREYCAYKKTLENKKNIKRRLYALFSLLEEYYSILGCSTNDSFEEVRQKYLTLVKQYHPDRLDLKNSSLLVQYTKKFHDIQYAYNIIKSHYSYEKKATLRIS
jgi:molecular chaperone DnaJ